MNLIKPCKCGDIGRPYLYGEGYARQEIAGPGTMSEIYFTEFEGYVIECPICGQRTCHMETPDKAVDAWNKDFLYVDGTAKKEK